jgi:multidrug efflux pump subunit AcrA (membrane-fusion protein)
MTVANLKALQVAASIDETTIKKVSEGQEATITFDSLTGQTFTGKVGAVPLQGTLQGGVTVYTVPIAVTGAEKATLLVGMTANVKISAGSVTNALLVPTMAITKSSGQYQVSVPNTTDPTGDPETITVQIGLSDGTYTQVTKGLNLGDNVIVKLASTATSTAKTSSGGIFSSLTGMFGRR